MTSTKISTFLVLLSLSLDSIFQPTLTAFTNAIKASAPKRMSGEYRSRPLQAGSEAIQGASFVWRFEWSHCGFRCMVYPCPNMSVVSHLGPLPMLLYIHDLTKISLWLSFAASKLDLHVGSDNRGRSGAEENRYAEG
ncbi:MAG: hypothetical protein NXY57DRAFT_1025733 [Lentinula lateritia]|nr:MAG: hypothetical protein NXY57DRAFT_1025733 [Lentinula lateritia]